MKEPIFPDVKSSNFREEQLKYWIDYGAYLLNGTRVVNIRDMFEEELSDLHWHSNHTQLILLSKEGNNIFIYPSRDDERNDGGYFNIIGNFRRGCQIELSYDTNEYIYDYFPLIKGDGFSIEVLQDPEGNGAGALCGYIVKEKKHFILPVLNK